MKRSTPLTKGASRHMGRIKEMPCICCTLLGRRQESTTDAHHIREDREERNDFLTIPLCHSDCHQGTNGVHGDKTYLRLLKMSEWGLLAATIERMK
jgi:hypothetical protein